MLNGHNYAIPSEGDPVVRAMMKARAAETFIDKMAAARWRWGSVDCSMIVSSWIYLATGNDPGQRFRGAYHSAEEAKELLIEQGGYRALVERLALAYGLPAIEAPAGPAIETGDVGLVKPDRDLQAIPVTSLALAIRLGDWWAVKTMTGVAVKPLETIRAWHI